MRGKKRGMVTYQYLVLVVITFFMGLMAFYYMMDEHVLTAHRMQDTALSSASQAAGKGLSIVEIFFQDGRDNNYDQTVGYGYVRAKTKPNFRELSFYDVFLHLDTEHHDLVSYKFNPRIDCNLKDNQSIHSIYNQDNKGFFGVKNYFTANNSFMRKNDIVLLCFAAPYEMGIEEQIMFTITIQSHSLFSLTTNLPASIDEESEFVYPKRVT